MEKGVPSSLFVNDGSFMERFKQLQQQKDDKDKSAALEESKPPIVVKGSSAPKPSIAFNKVFMERKTGQTPSGGKLAFSLKQKSKLVAPPVKLDADEDEEDQDAGKLVDEKPIKKQKLGRSDASEHASKQVDVAYILITNQHWWKEMFNERFGICGTPDTRVICILFFMLLALISFISDVQHHLPPVILL